MKKISRKKVTESFLLGYLSDTPCVCPLHINQHPVNGHYFEIRVGGMAVFIWVGYIKHNEHTHIKIICVEGSENLICGLQTATFCNKISDLR